MAVCCPDMSLLYFNCKSSHSNILILWPGIHKETCNPINKKNHKMLLITNQWFQIFEDNYSKVLNIMDNKTDVWICFINIILLAGIPNFIFYQNAFVYLVFYYLEYQLISDYIKFLIIEFINICFSNFPQTWLLIQ